MKETVIQSTVTPTLSIVVQGEAGAQDKTWKLCLDYRALAKIEETTGLDLKDPGEWSKIKSGSVFPKVVWCCLGRYSPDVTIEEVLDVLNPQAHALLWNALYEITFPGLVEAVREWKAKGTSPNDKPVTTTT